MNPFDSGGDPPDFVDAETAPTARETGPRGETPIDAVGMGGPADGSDEGDRAAGSSASIGRAQGAADRSRTRRGAGRRRSGRRGTDREPPTDNPDSPDNTDADADPHDVARTIVLRQLTMAPRSRKQLADKLRQRGCDDEIAEQVLDRMQDVGLIDDAAYAGMLVRSQQASRGLAKRALAQELRRKGVDDELVREQLDDIDEDGERDRARALVTKKLRSMHGLDAQVQTRRLAGMLARKGYTSSVSWSVIREAIADAPEHQPD